MESDEPKFVQAAPAAAAAAAASGSKIDASEEKIAHTRTTSGWGRQLREDEVDEDADGFLVWLSRYPVERNHPRPSTGTIALKKSGDAVVCHATDTISDVMQKLIVEGFLSLPVLSVHDGRLIGHLSQLDILWFVIHSFGIWRGEQKQQTAAAAAGGATGSGRAPLSEQVANSRANFSEYLALDRFRNAAVQDVLGRPGFGTRNLSTHVYRGFSLFHVFESMARLGSHRVSIVNSERKVTGLITQSMVISLLDQHLDRLGSLATSHTVEEMIAGLSDELRCVQESDMTLDAFKAMVTHNVSGLAVVNAQGELVDNISVRDLRGMGADASQWTSLFDNVADFKRLCRSKFSQQTPSSPIFVTKTDTLERVIKCMDDGNIHRVFVAETRGGKPIPSHCISQRDVLRYLVYLCGMKNTVLEDLEAAAEVL